MRIARRPSSGAAEPQRAVGLDRRDHGVRPGVAGLDLAGRVLEPDQHLVEDDVVEHAGPGRPLEARREPPGVVRRAADHSASPDRPSWRSAAQTAKRRARRDDPRAPSCTRALAAGRLDVVRGAQRHRGVVGGRVGGEREAGVVGHVAATCGRRWSTSRRPHPLDQVPALGDRRPPPQAERAVDVEPAAIAANRLDDRGQWVEAGPVFDVARLRAHERRPVDGGAGGPRRTSPGMRRGDLAPPAVLVRRAWQQRPVAPPVGRRWRPPARTSC